MVWWDGVDTGGTCLPDDSLMVELKIDYDDGTGFHLFKTYDSITSPDEDGDGDIDAVDQTVFMSGYLTQSVHRADTNGDGVVDVKDYDRFVAHKSAP